MPHRSTLFAALAFAALSSAQSPQSTTPPVAVPGIWRIPIHTLDADPEWGEYGVWASGDTYKVSFGDGFVFHPVLGADYPESQSFRWTTRSARVADTEIFDATVEPTTYHTDWRYEYRRPGLTEAYDVLPHGVEQTFIVHDRPRSAGDLVVRGTVTTDLVAPSRPAVHGELVFSDRRGARILSYGAAFAFDAAGRRTSIPTSFDGRTVTLTVATDWLADATYPVTIDPLTVPLFYTAAGHNHDIGRNGELDQLLTVFARSTTGLDRDVVAVRTTDTFTDPVTIFSDLASAWTTDPPECCYNGLVNRWAIAFTRTDVASSSVRVYLHDHASASLNSGPTLALTPPAGSEDHLPTIGGTGAFLGNPLVYLAWQRDPSAGSPRNTRVYGVTVNIAGSGGFHTPQLLSSGRDVDAQWPSVNKQSLGGDWVVAWQQYDNPINDGWHIRAGRVTNGGVLRGVTTVAPPVSARHQVHPQVAGATGRWLFSFSEADKQPGDPRAYSSGVALAVRRGDWAGTGALSLGLQRDVPITGGTAMNWTRRSLAYDSNTDSHWALGYFEVGRGGMVARFGRTGCGLELIEIPDYPFMVGANQPAIVFNEDESRFALVLFYGGLFPSGAYGAHLFHPRAAKCTTYGTGCSGTPECVNGLGPAGTTRGLQQPFAGSEFLAVRLENAVPNQGYVMYVAAGPASTPLGPGCTLNLDASLFQLLVGTTNSNGRHDFKLSLPDCGRVRGDLYFQCFTYHDSQIESSAGLKMEVR